MAQSLKPPFPSRRGRLLAVAAALLVGLPFAAPGTAAADTSPVPSPPLASCLHERFPHAGNPRNGSPFEPYEIPFTAGLNGGYLEIANSSVATITLGDPTAGRGIQATACGLFALPNQSGAIPGNPYGATANPEYNNNFVFQNPIPVTLSLPGFGGLGGVESLSGYGSANGPLTSQIDHVAAANGGMNVEFYGSSKATACLAPPLTGITNVSCATSAADGGECTIPIGNLLLEGVPSGDLTTPAAQGGTGLTYAEATTPVHLTSQKSGNQTGQPITGPITSAHAVLVSNDFPVGAIVPSTTPSPDAPGAGGTTPLCSAQSANTFNSLLGLPSPPGKNTFYAPGTFAIHTSE